MPVLEAPALPSSLAAPRRTRRGPRRSRRGGRLAAALLLAALVGCAPAAMPLTAEHPASPEAPTGRLAGPPPALRPGVADAAPAASEPAKPAPPSSPPAGHDHDHGASHEGHHYLLGAEVLTGWVRALTVEHDEYLHSSELLRRGTR